MQYADDGGRNREIFRVWGVRQMARRVAGRTVMTLLVIGIGVIIAVTGARGGAAAQTVASILQATLMEANQQTSEITTDEFRKILADGSATVFDARPFKEYASLVLPGKDVGEVKKAKDDGRLPMEDHNTRIIVFGKDSAQVRAVAEAVAREAFHNVSYFVGRYETLKSVLK